MPYTPVTNLYEVAQDEWTPTQFRDKVIYQALLEALTKEVQSLEDLMYQMYSLRSLPYASGQQLDNIGTNMGVPRRLGLTDAEYRTTIYAEIFMRRSDGSANYIMNAMRSIYNSDSVMIFEHNTAMTGGVVVKVHQQNKLPSAVPILKKMSAVAIQSVAILRDPTPLGYAWTPVEVADSTSPLVDNNDNWFITDGGLGVVVQVGGGTLIKDKIGTLADPGVLETPLGIDTKAAGSSPPDRLGIYAKSGDRNLIVDKYTILPTGSFGIMAEVSQLRQGKDFIEGEQ